MPRRSRPAHQTEDYSYIVPALRPLAVAISTLVFDPHNARTHSDENAQAIEGSLRRYGQRVPITYNPRLGNRVITGNERLRIAKDILGWTHIAAIAVEEDEQSSVGFAIVDNRAAELAGWDERALGQAIRMMEPTMNEQLDRMAVELAQQMRVTMPAMEEQLQPRRAGGRLPATPEAPEPGDTATAGTPGATTPTQRTLQVGGETIPITPEEEQAVLHRLTEYRQTYQTDFGFLASLMESATTEAAPPEPRRGRRSGASN